LQNDINNTLQNDTNNALQRINYCVLKEWKRWEKERERERERP
jgi:hypothetical protein